MSDNVKPSMWCVVNIVVRNLSLLKWISVVSEQTYNNHTNRVAALYCLLSLPFSGLSQDLLNWFSAIKCNCSSSRNNNNNTIVIFFSCCSHSYTHEIDATFLKCDLPFNCSLKIIVNYGKKRRYDDCNLSMFALFSLSIWDKRSTKAKKKTGNFIVSRM